MAARALALYCSERRCLTRRTDAVALPFNPSHTGTDELQWMAALDNAPPLLLPEADILVVSPHPDDETLGAGGLIRAAALKAHKVSVLSVTDGEAAFPDWRGLGRVRNRETHHALLTLSPWPIKRKRLRIPDGQVVEHAQRIHEALDQLATPTTLIVAPYERDGHPDHEAAGQVSADFARARGLPLWRYPIWAWHHSTPDRFADHRWGRFWLDPDTQRAKSMAMDCFKSQLRPASREPVVPAHVLTYFTRPFDAFLI